MGDQDCIVRSFHSTLFDISWLESRFQLFCDRKSQVDKESMLKRLENTKQLDRNIVYRELGRCHPAASLFCNRNEAARQAYMECFLLKSTNIREDLAMISIKGGHLAEAISLMEALKDDANHQDLYVESLKLFEVAHMIHFSIDEYRQSTGYGWILQYIEKYALHIQNKTLSYEDTFSHNGMQLNTFLSRIASIVDSVHLQPTSRRESKRKWRKNKRGTCLSDFIRKKKEKLNLIK
mgnify:CR=1 FL=1